MWRLHTVPNLWQQILTTLSFLASNNLSPQEAGLLFGARGLAVCQAQAPGQEPVDGTNRSQIQVS